MSVDAIKHAPPMFLAAYSAIAVLYLILGIRAMRKIMCSSKYAKEESIGGIVYGYYVSVALATILMFARTIANMFMCDNVIIMWLRVVSNSLIICVLFMYSKLLQIMFNNIIKTGCTTQGIRDGY